ncbi:MAG: TRAP transporter permease, partial [Sediminispirochaetaceae bacterium]
FALTRNSVGGPAKAAVVGSAFLGSISGSAIANVSSTGVFTIPMMKKIGYKPHVAAAIEAAASTGGQIMPPIMGAVAFIMAEFTQIPYLKIVGVAVLPIMLYFATVYTFVHIEAKKNNIRIKETLETESALTILKEGWHFFFAIIIIVVIMAFGYPPNLSALGGITSLVVIDIIKNRRFDYRLYYESLVLGGKYSLSIGSLVACIGIILSMVGLTGVGLKFSWLFTTLSHGSPFLAIFLVGLISMILGMGLASSAAYIVTAVAVGPALMNMGFPILAAHFIMIWFSIDSEITPPVGLASIVGAGIARADAMKTMFTAFKYAKGLYILPFMFYFRPAILLQDSVLMIISTGIAVLLGLLAFVSVWENYCFGRTGIIERIVLLAATGFLFVPGFTWNGIGAVLLGLVILKQIKFPRKIKPALA